MAFSSEVTDCYQQISLPWGLFLGTNVEKHADPSVSLFSTEFWACEAHPEVAKNTH